MGNKSKAPHINVVKFIQCWSNS